MIPRIITLLTGLLVVLSLATPAQAFSPIQKTQYNVTRYAGGSTAQQLVNINQMISAIDSAPKGATIRTSIYSYYSDALNAAYIRAFKRGVYIHFVTHDYAAKTSQTQKLKATLGTNLKAKSWMKVCSGSCARSGSGYILHSKLLTISSLKNGSKTVRYVTFTLSGNMGEGAGVVQWNQFQTIVDEKFYLGTIKYIEKLKDDRDLFDFPTVSNKSGSIQMSFFPRKKQQAEPIYEMLKDLSPKYGCKIRFAQYIWGSSNQMIADRVAVLKKGGCDVKVVLTNSFANKNVVSTLVKAGVPTYNSEVGGSYMHAKVTLLQGRVNGTQRTYSWTGSKNMSKPGASGNTETLIRISGTTEFNSQTAWVDRVIISKGVQRYSTKSLANSKTLAGSNQI